MSAFAKARQALHPSSAPESLPCRDAETQQIEEFVRSAVCNPKSAERCLYVSGMPGTGKTATIHAVLTRLGHVLPPFVAAELNALRFPHPTAAFSALWCCITGGEQVAATRARELLDAHFNSRSKGRDRRPVVCVIDEVDSLAGGRQAVLYALLEWATRPQGGLAVIAVANTMDLPERLLPRLASRAGVRRLVFAPYTHEQLRQVVLARLQQLAVFDREAVEFAARKVALLSGDARRALQVARRATEWAERAGAAVVRLPHVQAAVRESEAAPAARALAAASTHERLLLACLSAAVLAGPNGVTAPLGDVCARHVAACRVADLEPPAYSQLAALAARLAASHLLTAQRTPDGETWLGEAVDRDTLVQAVCHMRAGAHAMGIEYVPPPDS